jgi:hypothetical protein
MTKLISFINKEGQMILTLKCGCSGNLVCNTHTTLTFAHPPMLEPNNLEKVVAQFSTNKETLSGAPDGGLMHMSLEQLSDFADNLKKMCDIAKKRKNKGKHMVDYKKHPTSQLILWAEFGLSEQMSLDALNALIGHTDCTNLDLEYIVEFGFTEKVQLTAKRALKERE